MSNPSLIYKAYQLIAPQAADATVTGTGIDIGTTTTGKGMATFSLGSAVDTGATCAVTIEGSDVVGGTYTNLGTFTTVGPSDDNKVGCINIDNEKLASKRFIRAKATIAGGTDPVFYVSVTLHMAQEIQGTTVNSATIA